jgi:hypothetical protein
MFQLFKIQTHKKHCRIVVVCAKCVIKHHISECNSSITEKYKCARRAKIVNTSHDHRNAKCVVKKSRKQNTFDKFECDYISWTNRRSFLTCFNLSLIRRQHHSRFRSRIRKSFFWNEKWSKSRKKKRLKSNIFFEFFSISRRIESENNMTSFRDKNSWANIMIMNSKNMKKTLHRNSMSRFKFANRSFVNVNASIVMNQMIDFDFL